MIGAFYLSIIFRRKLDDNFRELASRLGLNCEIPNTTLWKSALVIKYPKLHGKVNNYDIQIYATVRSGVKNVVFYMAFDINTNINSTHYLRIFHDVFIEKYGKLPDFSKDIEINDPEFDRLYFVSSDNADFAKTILSDMVLKNNLIKERRLLNNGELKFEKGILRYEGIKSLYHKKEVENLEKLVKLSLLIADRIKSMS